jgi:methylmalonyl-CoA mutase N-terminal domain/subunit
MLSAIEAGYVQREIERAAYDYQKAVEAQEEIVVGVNRFQIKEETSIPTLKIDPAFEQAQIERVRKVRAERNAAAVKLALDQVEQAANSGDNLMPPIIAAVEAYATLGEIADRMRSVFGEYTEAAY